MKSERRHELQTNQLADWLGQNIEKARPYSKAVLGGLILVLGLVAVFAIMKSRDKQREAEAWDAYFAAMVADPEDFGQVASDYASTEASVWARLTYAESIAARGMGSLFTNRSEGLADLDTASDAYQTLLSELSNEQESDPLVAGRIHLQLGRVKEAQQQFTDAEEQYNLVIEKWPESAVAERAQWSLDLMGRLQADRFYSAFYEAPVPTPPGQGSMPAMPGTPPATGLEPIEGTEDITDPSGLEGPTGEFEPLDPFGTGDTGGDFPEPGPVDETGAETGDEDLPLDGAGGETTPPAAGETTPAAGDAATETAPAAETPAAETPAADAPAAETPDAETPAAETPLDTPTTDAPPAPSP